MSRWLRVPWQSHVSSRNDAKTTEEKSVSSSSLATCRRVPDRNYTLLPKAIILSLTAEACTRRLWKNSPQFSLIIPNLLPATLRTGCVFLRQLLCSLFIEDIFSHLTSNDLSSNIQDGTQCDTDVATFPFICHACSLNSTFFRVVTLSLPSALEAPLQLFARMVCCALHNLGL